MNSSLARVATEIERDVSDALARIGLLFRVFGRAKSPQSLETKILSKSYSHAPGRHLLQDLIGVRVALYFSDDVHLTRRVLEEHFRGDLVDATVDAPEHDTFRPSRVNLVFRMTSQHSDLCRNILAKNPIDNTFEIQVRTVLSEGWHEVEHDLRYKNQGSWSTHDDLSRMLNGILAGLETADWSMLQLFDELALRHYRGSRWGDMLRAKYRLRLVPAPFDDRVLRVFDVDHDFARSVFRASRSSFLEWLARNRVVVPISLGSLTIALANWLQRTDVLDTTDVPSPIADAFQTAILEDS